MAKKAAAKKVAAKKVARTRVTDDDLIGDAPKKPATKQAAPRPTPLKEHIAENADLPPFTNPAGRVINGVNIPPYPPELATIEDGQKSPAVKKWYKDHHPEAYKVLFNITVG